MSRPTPVVSVRTVKTESDADGLLVELTVRRFALGVAPYGGYPSASDVPPDVRAALRAWLDTAQEAL